eukprot:2980553-Rhodomonas_salina.1
MSSGSPYVSRAEIMTDYLPSLSQENQAQVTRFFADFDGVGCWVPPTLTLCRAIYWFDSLSTSIDQILVLNAKNQRDGDDVVSRFDLTN